MDSGVAVRFMERSREPWEHPGLRSVGTTTSVLASPGPPCFCLTILNLYGLALQVLEFRIQAWWVPRIQGVYRSDLHFLQLS